MDENTWKFVQIMMWLFGVQTSILAVAFGFIWSKINRLEARMDRIEQKMNDIDKRLVVVETLLHMKECCVLKDDKSLKKVE